MSKKNLFLLLVGIVCAVAVIIGVYLILTDGSAFVGGIATIVISLASGLIAPNPISLVALIAGICMLVFSPKLVGVILVVLGMSAMVANSVVWLKIKD